MLNIPLQCVLNSLLSNRHGNKIIIYSCSRFAGQFGSSRLLAIKWTLSVLCQALPKIKTRHIYLCIAPKSTINRTSKSEPTVPSLPISAGEDRPATILLYRFLSAKSICHQSTGMPSRNSHRSFSQVARRQRLYIGYGDGIDDSPQSDTHVTRPIHTHWKSRQSERQALPKPNRFRTNNILNPPSSTHPLNTNSNDRFDSIDSHLTTHPNYMHTGSSICNYILCKCPHAVNGVD